MILAAVMAGAILGPIDASIVNVVLPTLASSFSASLAAVQWVPMAYLLAAGSLVLPFGRLGDLRGHRNVFLSGLLAFVGASLLLFVNRAQVEGLSARTVPLLVAAILCGTLFVRLERRTAEPMVALSIVGNRRVALGASAAVLHFMAQYVVVFLTPFLLSRLLGAGPGRVGLVLTAFPLAVLCVAAFAEGVRRSYAAGAAFALAAVFLASAGGGRRSATLPA